MHEIDQLTELIIGGAIEVHRQLGPGLSEPAYEQALCIELVERKVPFNRQLRILVSYKGHVVAVYRPDLVVAELVLVEVKSVEHLNAVHTAQLLTYLRVTGCQVGLLINFNVPVLKDGIRRRVLQLGEKTL